MNKMSKRNISYVQQDTPAFLKKFKEQVGYKEGPDINTKREALCRDEGSSDEDGEEEEPQIVVLKKGDLTKEEVDEATQNLLTSSDNLSKIVRETEVEEDKEESPPVDGRIIFKKPNKKKQDSKTKDSTSKSMNENSKKCKMKNTNLLSFGDDEEDDNDSS